jgi:hypothetical protein
MQMGLEISSPGESISEPKMVMPPMATGNMQSQQMSVIGLKKSAEHVARPEAGRTRTRTSAAITGNTRILARKNYLLLKEYSLKRYYFEPASRQPRSNGKESGVKRGSNPERHRSRATPPVALGISRGCS